MPEPEVLSVFLLAAVALGLAPGPDNIFVLAQSALYGRPAGFAVTLGLCTGLLVHTTAVAVGIASIVATSAMAFTAIKLIGAAYLLYLAWQAVRAGSTRLADQGGTQPALSRLYRRGIVMNITNPKVAIFFLAFLPQFADAASGPLALQLMVLGGFFILATLVVFGGIALCAGFLGEHLKHSPRAQVVLNRIAAVVFAGLAARLLVTER